MLKYPCYLGTRVLEPLRRSNIIVSSAQRGCISAKKILSKEPGLAAIVRLLVERDNVQA
jgi:hypothetical protein